MTLKWTHASAPSGSSGDEIAPHAFFGWKNFTVPRIMTAFLS